VGKGLRSLALAVFACLACGTGVASASPTITFEDGKTKPVFDLTQATRERVYIPQPHIDQDGDGVDDKIAIEIIRPKESGPGLKVPAIVDPSPYYTTVCRGIEGECIADTNNDGLNDKWPLFYDNYFVPRGYAVIYAESNGTGNSTGCPLHGGPDDIAGMKSVIDWLNGRTPGVDKDGNAVTASWHNGNSAMIGKSYDGTLTNGVAATGVAGLKTIIPISAISDWYQYSRMGGQRLSSAGTHYPANLSNTITNSDRRTLCAPTRTAMSAAGSSGDGDGTGDYNDFWNARNYLPNVANVKASVFETHGLQDDNVTTPQFSAWWQGLTAANVPRKLWLLREGHVDPFDSRRAVFVDTLHRWLDHWLLGADNGIMNGPRVDIEDDKDDWHSYDDWPVPGTQDESVFLQGTSATDAGVLGLTSGGNTDTATFSDSATQSETTMMTTPAGAQTARRVFLSPVLTHDLRISGVPRLDLRASLSTTQSNLGALIVDYGGPTTHINLSGDGIATNTAVPRTCWGQGYGGNTPADGCYYETTKPTVSVSQWRVTRGILDSSNRDSLFTGTLAAPDTMYTFRIGMNADDYTFKAGHQIGVVVVGDYFGVDGPPGATVTVDTRASQLHLPVAGGYNAAVASGAFTPDTVAPALNAPTDIKVIDDDPTGAVVTYPAPAATDNEDPAPSASCNPASGTRFPHGATAVTCTARDASGNVTTKTFTVTIARTGEDTPPQGDVPAPPAPDGGGPVTPSPAPPTGGTTPADSGGPSPTLDTVDRLAPKLAGLQLRAGRHSLRLNFKLSEPATVTVTIGRHGQKKVLQRLKAKAGKGKRSLTLRSAKLGPGRYTVKITAVDGAGNARHLTRTVTLRR
jgi:X-Pro dipeptidyl-peptidase